MTIRLPSPRRGIRSGLLGILLLLGPYLLLRQLRSIDSHSLDGVEPDFIDKNWAEKYDDRPNTGGSQRRRKDRGALILQEDGDGRIPNEDADTVRRRLRKGKGKAVDQAQASALLSQHTYLDNGLLLVNPQGQHPIYDLVDRAKDEWELKKARASKNLREAAAEYRRRYGRPPPKGFDRWWAYARRHKVQLPDEYDQIHKDLEPFHALTPYQLAHLVEKASQMSGMYTIYCPGISGDHKGKCRSHIVEEGLNEEGATVARQRADAQLGLLEEIEADLEEVEAVFYSHDVPWQFVGHEYRGALEDAAQVGDFMNVEEHPLDTAHLGWASACAPHKPLREEYDPDVLPDMDKIWNGPKSFIWDHKAAMDPCIHPTTSHTVGFLSGHGKGPGPSKELFPVMAMCKTTLHSDVLAVSMEAWTEDVGDDPPWDRKTDDRLLWRGKTTGIYFKDGVPWNISQRATLVSQTAKKEGDLVILPISDRSKPVGSPAKHKMTELNRDLVDVAFVDEPIQCDEDVCKQLKDNYYFGPRKNWNQGNQYKYLLDLDGNGWSARFKRLMSTNSVVLKSTIFPEWYSDRLQPWLHYVPIKADLSDLYDVLAFFRGGHDDMAREIAVAGKEWSQTFWRKEDMVAYQFRLFLELSRLMSIDREEASYHLRDSGVTD